MTSTTLFNRLRTAGGLLAALLFGLAAFDAAFAQVSGRAFSGFGSDNKDPIQINADRLEVVDGESKATFTGNVTVRQGSSVINTDKLEVTYGKNPDGSQGDVQYMVLTGNVVAISKDNTAKADFGTYDVRTEIVTLTGREVIVAQGKNVAKGCKLVANLKTNTAAFRGKCRVSTVFIPGSQPTN